MADRQFAVALVTDAVGVKVGLVRIDGIGAVVDWASAYQISRMIVSKFWIAEIVTVCVSAGVAVIRESVEVGVRNAFRIAGWERRAIEVTGTAHAEGDFGGEADAAPQGICHFRKRLKRCYEGRLLPEWHA